MLRQIPSHSPTNPNHDFVLESTHGQLTFKSLTGLNHMGIISSEDWASTLLKQVTERFSVIQRFCMQTYRVCSTQQGDDAVGGGGGGGGCGPLGSTTTRGLSF